MEITLEKIELVKDRTGVTYKEAKEALEATDGNVVDAIIAIEQSIDQTASEKVSERKEELIEKMKNVVKKGNVSKIRVTREGETILNIPLSIGVIGTVMAPWGVIAATVAAFGFKCRIEFVKDDGSVINLSEKAEDMYEDAKEKAPDVYEDLKEKGEEALSKAKYAARDVRDKLKRKDAEGFEDFGDFEDIDDMDFAEFCEEEASEGEKADCAETEEGEEKE